MEISLQYRTQLYGLLTKHFDLEELKTLCFNLGVTYDDLRGEGNADKARELVLYLERLDRIPDLTARCAQLRPNISWQPPGEPPPEQPKAAPDRSSAPTINQGLIALAEIMQSPEVRTAVAAFRAHFEATCRQINILSDYKRLHDSLQLFQYDYDTIVMCARDFPAEDGVDMLRNLEPKLQDYVNGWRDVIQQGALDSEKSWVQKLVEAQGLFGQALQESNPDVFKKAIALWKYVLNKWPTYIDVQLNGAALAQSLPDLVERLKRVSKHLAGLPLNQEKVSSFEASVDGLVNLSQVLTVMVADHHNWQGIDVELRGIAATIGQDVTDLEIGWPDLKLRVQTLCGDCAGDWATKLKQSSDKLDQAMATNDPRLKQCFKDYRRQVTQHFSQVDVELKKLCEDLRKAGEPLALVMEVMA